MYFYAGMIAYNEADIIACSIESFLHAVDKLVVIDGSPWGPSTDETRSIAQSFGKKVIVVSGFFEGKYDQVKTYLNLMEKDHNNWCHLIDADEVWDEESLKTIVAHCENGDDETLLYTYHFRHFYTPTKIIHGGLYGFPRIIGTFRLEPGIQFLAPSFYLVGLDDGVPLQDKGDPIWKIVNDVLPFHYGHYRSLEKMLFKIRLYWDRGDWNEIYSKTEEEWKKIEACVRESYSFPRLSFPINPSVEMGKGNFILEEFKGKHPEAIMPYLKKMEGCLYVNETDSVQVFFNDGDSFRLEPKKSLFIDGSGKLNNV